MSSPTRYRQVLWPPDQHAIGCWRWQMFSLGVRFTYLCFEKSLDDKNATLMIRELSFERYWLFSTWSWEAFMRGSYPHRECSRLASSRIARQWNLLKRRRSVAPLGCRPMASEALGGKP